MAQSSWLRVLILALFVNLHQTVLRLLNKIVPAPYLDEVFHIPQAQKYWRGKWTDWDPKITTPPGVYVWSYLFSTIRGVRDDDLSTEDLRFSNAVLLYGLVLVLTMWTTIARRQVDTSAVLQKEFVMVAFPLLFFFSGLYYTDLFSALTAVLTCAAWEAGLRYRHRRWIFQTLHLVAGLLSLGSRQTNIFWASIFLAGLQVVESIKTRVGADKVHDPDVANAWFEDYFYFAVSIVQNCFNILPHLILDLWPQLALLASFTGFVVWNGGVVLGDKQNHVATIHTPQLLYIWPMMVFFSWPVMLSSLAAQLQQQQPFNLTALRTHLPRAWVSGLVMAAMVASVHFNTIVHPFTLADNRHYTFYVFRLLTRPTWVKYVVVPIYFACAWLVITALGHAAPSPASTLTTTAAAATGSKPSTQEQTTPTEEKNNVTLSFLLIWILSTTLSLVTAPLVEPRYFIIPWLTWRLHVPEPVLLPHGSDSSKTTPSDFRGQSQPKSSNKSISSSDNNKPTPISINNPLLLQIQTLLVNYVLYFELAWYIAINTGTIYVFLHRGFTWLGEPGKIQRFMW